MVLGDLSSIAGLNETTVVQSIPVEYNILLGSIFLFIGVAYIMWIYSANNKEKKRLKRF